MQQIGLWHVTGAGPRKLKSAHIALEQQLEEWIERDPAVLESGLTIVGRQVKLDAGPLDLLAIDPQGQWVVVELKRGALYRETVAQALDYAACIAAMPHEQLAARVNEYLEKQAGNGPRTLDAILVGRAGSELFQETPRDVRIYVVGTGRDPGLDRVVRYLAGTYEVPISVVSYQVFESTTGERILVRELTEPEVQPIVAETRTPTVDEVCAKADQSGIGAPFRRILEVAKRHGLYARPNRKSIMYAPPTNRTRCLFTVWCEPTKAGEVWLWVAPEALTQFYGFSADAVVRELGPGDVWRKVPVADLDNFVAGLDRLFQGNESTPTSALTNGTRSSAASANTGIDGEPT